MVNVIENNVIISGRAKIGKDVHIRQGAIIYDAVFLGDNVHVGHYAVIRLGSIIHDNVSIGSFNQIEGDCEIGEGTRFHSNVHITRGSKIGKYCFIGPGFVSTNVKYPLSPKFENDVQGIVVEDFVKIGGGVTITPGVRIGRNSLIGAGSVVICDIPSNVLAIGNPCRVIKNIDEVADYLVMEDENI